jgi:hypothetical protein
MVLLTVVSKFGFNFSTTLTTYPDYIVLYL